MTLRPMFVKETGVAAPKAPAPRTVEQGDPVVKTAAEPKTLPKNSAGGSAPRGSAPRNPKG